MNVVKKRVYLTPELERTVKVLSGERGQSESSFIREAAVQYVARVRPAPDLFEDIVDLDSSTDGPTDLSANHDSYLYPARGNGNG